MTPSQLYKEETQNGKLKAEIKELLSTKALSRYEAEELIQLNVLNEISRPRKIRPLEIKRIAQNHNMLPSEKLDLISHLYMLNGYEILDRDRLEIKVKRKKKFSYMSAFLWFLLLGVGLVIYILYYLFKGDDFETITIADNYKAKPEVEVIIEEEVEISEDIVEESEINEEESQEETEIAQEQEDTETEEEISEEIQEVDNEEIEEVFESLENEIEQETEEEIKRD